MSKQTTNKPITTKIIKNMKGAEKISMLTAYDYSMAKLVDRAGIDMILCRRFPRQRNARI